MVITLFNLCNNHSLITKNWLNLLTCVSLSFWQNLMQVVSSNRSIILNNNWNTSTSNRGYLNGCYTMNGYSLSKKVYHKKPIESRSHSIMVSSWSIDHLFTMNKKKGQILFDCASGMENLLNTIWRCRKLKLFHQEIIKQLYF